MENSYVHINIQLIITHLQLRGLSKAHVTMGTLTLYFLSIFPQLSL